MHAPRTPRRLNVCRSSSLVLAPPASCSPLHARARRFLSAVKARLPSASALSLATMAPPHLGLATWHTSSVLPRGPPHEARFFLAPEAAAAALRNAKRELCFLSHAWRTVVHPDPDGATLDALLRFLRSPVGSLVKGVFLDFPRALTASKPTYGRRRCRLQHSAQGDGERLCQSARHARRTLRLDPAVPVVPQYGGGRAPGSGYDEGRSPSPGKGAEGCPGAAFRGDVCLRIQ